MEKRLALIGIIVSNRESDKKLNDILRTNIDVACRRRMGLLQRTGHPCHWYYRRCTAGYNQCVVRKTGYDPGYQYQDDLSGSAEVGAAYVEISNLW